jgi:hypothetical protein
MKFTNKAPKWDAEGIAPPESLQKSGFLAGYKPPAHYFNYLFNGISKAINEVQTGLSNVDNTADAKKPVSTEQKAAIDAMAISGSGYGKIVNIPDAANAPFNALTLLGACEQFTTTGKNLFKPPAAASKDGITLTAVKDYFVLNGTAETSGFFYVDIAIEEAGMYTLSANNPTNNGKEVPLIQVYSPTTLNSIAAFDNENYKVSSGTLEAGNNYQCRIRYEAGCTYNYYIVRPQLEKGSTATKYEMYTGGAAPNPDYPQSIKSVGDNGSVVIRTTKKNLFQIVPNTQNGVTLSAIDDYFMLNGTCTESTNFVLTLPYDLEAGTYTISANNPKNNGVNLSLIDVHNGTIGETLAAFDNANYNVNTMELSGGRYACRVRIEKGVTYDNFIFKPQLEKGSTATKYEAYTESTVEIPLTIPLYGIPVSKDENYTDKNGNKWYTDEIDLNKGVYRKRLSTVDLSILEWIKGVSWWQATIEDMQYTATNLEYGVALAEYYRIRIASGMTTAEYGEFAIDTNNIKVVNGSNTEKPKGLLVYRLAEPIEMPLTTEQLAALYSIYSYEGCTNVSTNDIGEIVLEYFKNTDNGKAMSVLKQNYESIMLTLGDMNTALDEIIGGA